MKIYFKIKNSFVLLIFLFSYCTENKAIDITEENLSIHVEQENTELSIQWSNTKEYEYDLYKKVDNQELDRVCSHWRKENYRDPIDSIEIEHHIKYMLLPSSSQKSPDKSTNQCSISTQAITDETLLDEVEFQTLKYFTEFAHPSCGMARERSNGELDVVTTGGSGFGIMALVAGVHRGLISRNDALLQIQKIVNFLSSVDRFHGAWAHWYYGSTGKVKPFSPDDNGGDLVETSFLLEGLLTARSYFNSNNNEEMVLREQITKLWEEVEFDWYTKGGENHLIWHWSPTVGWKINMPIGGWNEGLICYVLAASSPTHAPQNIVDAYTEGWAKNGTIRNGKSYYNIMLPLGNDREMGGPLFFAHYSFLGLDPRKLIDAYANYWEQNVAHSKIQYNYCIENPNHFQGYGEELWGLTASDDPIVGYMAHAPGENDNGTISPTAALSSMPYSPKESLRVLKSLLFTYNALGKYGFYDAINPTLSKEKQYVKSFLAIDQGPIIIMIENYRSGIVWESFMKNKEIGKGLTQLGFSYE